MRAARCAAALLRGVAQMVTVPQSATPIGAQAAAELARRLDQGCAARRAATAAGPEPAGLHGAAAVAAQAVRKRRAPRVGKLGEKTTDGKPKPDERTVADLLRRGWFETEEEVVAVLTRRKSQKERYAFETAQAVADWLETRLAAVPLKDGQSAPARAIRTAPPVLRLSVELLQKGWDTLVRAQAEGGLGYTPERAAQRISADPRVLTRSPELVLKTAAVLEACGVADGMKAIAQVPKLLGLAASTLLEHADWWKQAGLDYKKILTAHPDLLGLSSASSHKHLQDKLDFLRGVAGMSDAELNNAASLFSYSLEDRMRPRYFYALQMGQLGGRFGINSLMQEKDSVFVAMMQGRPKSTKELASTAEVASYRALIASPDFVAWRTQQEAQRLRGSSP